MTRGTCEDAGLIVLNGGLGAAGRIAPGIFWNATLKNIRTHITWEKNSLQVFNALLGLRFEQKNQSD